MRPQNEKAPSVCGAQGFGNQQTTKPNDTAIHSRVKAIIVTLALWGLMPFALATWLIKRFRLGAS